MEQRPLIGVGIVVWKDGKILLGKRIVPHGYGFYSLPGGHLEYNETVMDCAKRELREETGLTELSEPVLLGYTDDFHPDSGKHYVTLYISGHCFSGEPRNVEPQKNEGWGWYELRNLPEPLWEPVRQLFRKLVG
jgi:8-oxo-dGTP diphosphatase